MKIASTIEYLVNARQTESQLLHLVQKDIQKEKDTIERQRLRKQGDDHVNNIALITDLIKFLDSMTVIKNG